MIVPNSALAPRIPVPAARAGGSAGWPPPAWRHSFAQGDRNFVKVALS